MLNNILNFIKSFALIKCLHKLSIDQSIYQYICVCPAYMCFVDTAQRPLSG